MFAKSDEELKRMELRATFVGSQERLNEIKKSLESDFKQQNEHKIGIRIEYDFENKEGKIFEPIKKKPSEEE